MIVVRLCVLATLTARKKAVVFVELEAGWWLEVVWMFWRRDSSLASAKI